MVRLEIVDDGRGFELAHLTWSPTQQGWGVITMTERIEALGGQCWIESSPGKGTRIIVEVAQ
jgi:signal transduction histidine kinase